MSEKVFDPPRWRGGPTICITANLPAFETEKALAQFHEANGPGTSIHEQWKCEACDCWHYTAAVQRKSTASNQPEPRQRRKNLKTPTKTP